jgi:hypothetical protein
MLFITMQSISGAVYSLTVPMRWTPGGDVLKTKEKKETKEAVK